jgi:predicted component of type VI protein secretion system
MTEVGLAGLVVVLTQAGLGIALVADRWVHRVTAPKSHETRLADLEASVAKMHQKASDFQTVQQVSVGKIELRLAAIDEHLRNTDLNVVRLERRRGDR